jgi:L-lactate dehydrogenase complex protein LldG
MGTDVMNKREQFLQRVRQAVLAGNRAGNSPELLPRGGTGYQGAGADPVGRFCTELSAAGGQPYRVADAAAAREQVLAIVQAKLPRAVLLGSGVVLESLDLARYLTWPGLKLIQGSDLNEEDARSRQPKADSRPPEDARTQLFAVDLSITGADFLIAETGSLVYLAQIAEPRSSSLLPPVHVAVAMAVQLLPDLFDLFQRIQPVDEVILPSCVTLVTGPSKTGDIELKLVTGVHGPGEVHVVIVG